MEGIPNGDRMFIRSKIPEGKTGKNFHTDRINLTVDFNGDSFSKSCPRIFLAEKSCFFLMIPDQKCNFGLSERSTKFYQLNLKLWIYGISPFGNLWCYSFFY